MLRKSISVWKEAPFLRLTIGFILGILVQQALDLAFFMSFALFGLALAGLILIGSLPLSARYALSGCRGALIHSLMVALGMTIFRLHDFSGRRDFIEKIYFPETWVVATLDQPARQVNNAWISQSWHIHILRAKNWVSTRGGISLVFDGPHPPPPVGSRLIFKRLLRFPQRQANPGAFDRSRYDALQGIFGQVLLRRNDYRVLENPGAFSFDRKLSEWQVRVLRLIKQYVPGEKESGFAEAMLIGYRDDLDHSILQSYSDTGTVHIIAISGLHLALIYAILAWAFSPLKRSRRLKWLSPLLTILFLWLFSLLAGASPSVMRSTLMFTAVVWGKSVSLHASAFNTLALSAFVLLCYNPFWVHDLGFQLSYLAVLSILIFYKPVRKGLHFSGKIPDLIWQSVAVCLAAQILTIPVCIMNFHRFPLYFLPANLVAVPLSSFILVLELALVALHFISPLAAALGFVISKLIWLLNLITAQIAAWPAATWNQLEISGFQALLLYLFIAGISFWLLKQIKAGCYMSLLALLLFFSLRAASFRNASRQQALIVYHIPRLQAMDCILGRQSWFFGQTVGVSPGGRLASPLALARSLFRIKNTVQIISGPQPAGFRWGNKTLLVIGRDWKEELAAGKIRVDFLILSNNPPQPIEAIAKKISAGLWIFDCSDSLPLTRRWAADCRSLGLDYYNIAEKGAFVRILD